MFIARVAAVLPAKTEPIALVLFSPAERRGLEEFTAISIRGHTRAGELVHVRA